MTDNQKDQKAQKPVKEPRSIATIPNTIPFRGGGQGRPSLPPAPDADDEAITAAERALGTTDPRKREVVVSPTTPRRSRRKKEQPATESMLVKGPKPVIDAFNKYKDDEGFRSSWAALEQLLLNSGVNMPDFDA